MEEFEKISTSSFLPMKRKYNLFVKICSLRLLYFLGIHDSPLDGSDIQAKTSKEQDPRKGKEIESGTL